MAVGTAFGATFPMPPESQPIQTVSEMPEIAPVSPPVNEIVEKRELSIPEQITDIGQLWGEELTELALAIHQAENPDNEECNLNGCKFGIGAMQIVQSTFDEQCEGDVYNNKDNILCAFKMLENGEYWRWLPSYEKWYPKLSLAWQKKIGNLPLRCSCVLYAHSQGVDVPLINADDIQPNSSPAILSGILFGYGHVGVIYAFSEEGFYIKEANFKKCEITRRLVEFNDPHIIGFYR